jgi:hypothetical protein
VKAEEFFQELEDLVNRGSMIPVRIVDLEGDIFDIKSVRLTAINGGELHIEQAPWGDE